MDDLISRQYAIEHYQHVCRRTNCKECPLHIQVTNTLTDCELELFLHNLPSAQPEPRWIPVEIEPPEFGKEVLISHKGTVSIDWLTQSEGWAYFFMSGAGIADIDAWMPLPESYRGGEDGE